MSSKVPPTPGNGSPSRTSTEPIAYNQHNPYYNDIIIRNDDGSNSTTGLKLMQEAKRGCDPADKFSGKEEEIHGFLKMLKRYSREFDWERIKTIKTTRTRQSVDIFNDYGKISLNEVIAYNNTNIWDAVVTREREKEILQKRIRLTSMFCKIQNCCTNTVLNELELNEAIYTKSGGQGDGLIFLKLLLDKFATSTIYSSVNIIKKFRTMKLSDYDNNIVDLYRALDTENQKLKALGETHKHLLIDVFSILHTSTNEDFCLEMKLLERQFEKGKQMQWNEVMDYAKTSYLDLVDKGTWDKKDPRDERIMALTTIVKDIPNLVAYATSSIKGLNNNSKSNQKTKNFKPIPDWKFMAPSDPNETKTVNNTKFYWCPNHWDKGMWVTHQAQQCFNKNGFVPRKYDASAQREAFHNKGKSNNSNFQAKPTGDIAPSFKLNDKLKMAMTAISQGEDNVGNSFLAAYGLDNDLIEQEGNSSVN